jgi:hypothetical protein
MDQLSLPFFGIVIAISVVFLFYATRKIRRMLGLARTNSNMIKIAFSSDAEGKIKSIIGAAKFPLIFDMVIEHIGGKPDIYLSSMKKDFSKLIKSAESVISGDYKIREDDYLIFHHGGESEVIGCELERDEALSMDFGSIDLSKVNEIGEGAAIRMVFISGKKVPVHMFFSAPSQFQLREIIEGATAPFKGKGCKVLKNKEAVLRDFNSPDFINRTSR